MRSAAGIGGDGRSSGKKAPRFSFSSFALRFLLLVGFVFFLLFIQKKQNHFPSLLCFPSSLVLKHVAAPVSSIRGIVTTQS